MVGRGNMQKRRFHGCWSGAGRGGREVGKSAGMGVGEMARRGVGDPGTGVGGPGVGTIAVGGAGLGVR
jgi:hypothetical protein